MSLLFKCFYDGDVDKFRSLLALPGYNAQTASRSAGIGGAAGSPGGLDASPRNGLKPRKAAGNAGLGRAEVNARDHAGLTMLLRAASSTSELAIEFVRALLDHPAVDIYVQDLESGWNSLHRALYAGNISIARLLLEKERMDLTGRTLGASLVRVGELIKTKDHEGNSPFDLFNCTIGERAVAVPDEAGASDSDSEREETAAPQGSPADPDNLQTPCGDELFAFGSNRNLSLGFGDEDDRQFPERVFLKRPEQLLQKFYDEYLESAGLAKPPGADLAAAPSLVLNRPLLIRDVVLSKFHSAVLTTDPVSNLYVCGVGRGGRLGLGDENTRFHYVPVQGGLGEKRVAQVALGQNHSMAVTDAGELWTWGSNANSQLGYALPAPMKKDEEPSSTSPRQVFGPLKKETILGVAASALHSVAHTGSSLYCWGRNVGQLALMDADSRSLEVQPVPRRVAASLFSSPIIAVSAVDKATTCLLANHTVVCFTSYGYNMVKFPFAESLGQYQLHGPSPTTTPARFHEASRNRIRHITSGGETVAALTARGDLFTFSLSGQKPDASATATSTTNPSKIRGAITQPQCVWSARREGVRSVGVGEHGSVIISTESGAVWRRVKRAKAKDAYVHGSPESRRKDFKFQRAPYITKVVAVRASPSGTFAAVRADSDVMRRQIAVAAPTLWDDLALLNPLRGFRASEPGPGSSGDTLKFWDADALESRLGPVAHAILKSPDLEADLGRHLTACSAGRYQDDGPPDAVLRTTSSPELGIPVHGWLFAARSPVLRHAMARHRQQLPPVHPTDLFRVEEEANGAVAISFIGLDLLSILNFVVYAYCDRVVPAWNYTRQAPPLAHRYRQVRAELMKAAARLEMPALEAAVRLQTDPKRSLDQDLGRAVKDRTFLEDGDALLELDGGREVPVHRALVCRRCPWFEGLFGGRSGGMWLADRRERQAAAEPVRIDLKHVGPAAFEFVLEHIYSDAGEDLFDGVSAPSTDDLMDLVMDVMAAANELMLDRLSQICQKVMGRFVHTRNVAHLLNAISPCSVAEFKDAGLEYICLQIESMLENHLLDDLDEDLLLELDEVVRDNQLATLPFARSGRAELLLHEKYPDLAQDIDEERQRRVREMAFRAAQKDDERKLSSSLGARAKYGSLDDPHHHHISPSPARKVSRAERNSEPFSPSLKPRTSHGDLMFDMDEDPAGQIGSPLSRPKKPLLEPVPADPDGAVLGRQRPPLRQQAPHSPAGSPAGAQGVSELARRGASGGNNNPWGSSPLPTARRGLGEIIRSEAVTNKKSALSAGLAAQKTSDADAAVAAAPITTPSRPAPPKLSQKERKKQLMEAAQAAQQAAAASSTRSGGRVAWDRSTENDKAAAPAPWKTVGVPSRESKVVPGRTSSDTTTTGSIPDASRTPGAPNNHKPLVAAESSSSARRRTASPDTRFSGQARGPNVPPLAPPTTPASKLSTPSSSLQQQQPLVPHSRSYLAPPRKTDQGSPGARMADIIGQQKREQESVREAVAKRSLQEIQQEQAFQEWWDAESRRAQEEEEARQAGREAEGRHEGRKRRPRRGKAAIASTGREGEAAGSAAPATEGTGSGTPGRSRGKGGRGGGKKEAVRQ